MNLPYKPDDPASIIAFAKLLSGKTLKQSCDITIRQHGFKGKGNFGQVLEKFYFLYTPNSDTEPDFKEAGLELKASPLKKLQNGSYRSKERLVLNIIKYHEIVKEEFLASSFWKKNAHLLLVFYLHEPDTDILDFMIRLVDGWKFSETDLEIIKKDWQKIRRKVAAGQAHELSEGDTFYLGACTKGKNADTKRQQPFSNTPAKQRAYSLKQGYVNHMIATIAGDATGKYGKLLSSTAEARKGGIEQTVLGRFSRFIGKTVAQIVIKTGVQLNPAAKNFHASLAKAILGINQDKEISEFEKAGITIKAIRVEEDDSIVESVSFEAFRYLELVKEKWETSRFRETLESKFFFIFFKIAGRERVLHRAVFWNMPHKDIMQAKKVWVHTKRIVKKGEIVRSVNDAGIRKTNFMGKKDNPVSHVRPHAANAADTNPLPVPDRVTSAKAYTKHCFWLNNDYVRNQIYLKQVQ